MFCVFAYDAGTLIGTRRALADGRDCTHPRDIAVHPNHQGKGLGKDIIDRLVRPSASHRKVMLFAVPRQGMP